MINSITTEQLIIEFMEAGGEDLERLPPRFKLLIERLLEERKEFLERIKVIIHSPPPKCLEALIFGSEVGGDMNGYLGEVNQIPGFR